MTVMIEGLDFASLSEPQQQVLKKAYAAKIAATCNLPSNESVWDLLGENGTITVTDGIVEAFIAVPQGSFANTLARALYTSAFKEEMMQTTADVPGTPSASAVGTVVLKLEKFERQVSTTTLTATTSTVTTETFTETTTDATVKTTELHYDLRGSTTGVWGGMSSANRGLSSGWCELLLACLVAANMVN